MDIGTTLLEYGADTNAVTRQGISPIHLAAQEGSVDLVSLLLAKNADVNVCNKVMNVTVDFFLQGALPFSLMNIFLFYRISIFSFSLTKDFLINN